MRVDRDAARDREDPRAEVLPVRQPVVGTERPEEGLLERVVRPIAPEPPPQHAEHVFGVLRVERLERRDRGHGIHHPGKRTRRAMCEI